MRAGSNLVFCRGEQPLAVTLEGKRIPCQRRMGMLKSMRTLGSGQAGKATDFESVYRGFESLLPSHKQDEATGSQLPRLIV